MAHEDLESYYKTNFALVQHHQWSLAELEDMVPFERDIYLELVAQWVKTENAKIEDQNRKSGKVPQY